MTGLTTVELRAPYLVMIGDEPDPSNAKTGFGLVQWCRDRVAGQLRFAGTDVDLKVPDLDLEQARASGVQSLLIGVAPIGGVIPEHWWTVIEQAAGMGMDIVCGLHVKLADRPALVEAAEQSGARLVDVRNPPQDLPVGTGVKRTGLRLLTVGTDCAVGKKYTALALHREMQKSGMNSTFRASGQTGIMIAGEGIPIDSVVADFISGAAELISPENASSHWDLIEGQGSVFHPGYAGVSMGLLHGSQPDAFVVCHEAGRTEIGGWEPMKVPTISECIDTVVKLGRLTNPAIRCVGVSVNTSGLPEDERIGYLGRLAAETGLPCVDPLIDGCESIVELIRIWFHR